MDTKFRDRLDVACRQCPDCPQGHGRQAWVRRKLNVSAEAVSKWFSGDSRPLPDKMKKLAELLGVDEAWLSLGREPEMTPTAARARQFQLAGCANVLMGLLQASGAQVAPPHPGDPAAGYVSFYAILGGTHLAVHVALARRDPDVGIVFTVPVEFEACLVVGAIPLDDIHIEFAKIPPHVVKQHGQSRGGYIELVAHHARSGYRVGNNRLARIEYLEDLTGEDDGH